MQWIILFNLDGREYQSFTYMIEKNADDILAHVRTLSTHRWSKKVALPDSLQEVVTNE